MKGKRELNLTVPGNNISVKVRAAAAEVRDGTVAELMDLMF